MGETVFDKFRNGLAEDQPWAWSWFCNIAVPLMDRLDISHHDANVAAAHLFQHLFSIDVTGWKEYQDIINNPDAKICGTAQKLRTNVLKETVQEVSEVDENSIYVTITGFKENSGAEATAKALAELLKLQGYRAKLNIADTTLLPHERSPKEPEKNALFVVTGVESRWHTDRVGAAEVDAVAEQIVEAYAAGRPVAPDEIPAEEPIEEIDEAELCNCGMCCDYGDDADEPEFGEGGEDFAEGEDLGDPGEDPCCPGDCHDVEGSGRPWRDGRTKIDLILSNVDSNPILTVQHIEDQFPKADINVRMELDHYVTDAFHAHHQPRKQLILTLDPKDPDPEATVAAIQSIITEAAKKAFPLAVDPAEGKSWTTEVRIKDGVAEIVERTITPELLPEGLENGEEILADVKSALTTSLTMPVQQKRSLNNQEDLNGAHLIRHADGQYSIQFIDVTDEEFCTKVYPSASWCVAPIDNGYVPFRNELMKLLDENIDFPGHVSSNVYDNNEAFIKRFGDKTKVVRAKLDELNFMELDQGQVPHALWDLLEQAWTRLNYPEALAYLDPILKEPGDDFPIAIPLSGYLTLTGPGGMVFRKHPQHEKLFVRVIRKLATEREDVAQWAKRMEIL
uniref:Virion structural protein n=1 Tax=Pseudomonas phage RVTF4 TaxID=3236931 RepID=A0AB39CCG6_9VIRU